MLEVYVWPYMTIGSELSELVTDLGQGLWIYELSYTAQNLGNNE